MRFQIPQLFLFALPLILASISCASVEGRTANLRITTDPPMEGVPVYTFLLKEWNQHEENALGAGLEAKALRPFLAGKTPIEKHVVKLGYKHILYVDYQGMRGMIEFLPARKLPLHEVVIPLSALNSSNAVGGAKTSNR